MAYSNQTNSMANNLIFGLSGTSAASVLLFNQCFTDFSSRVCSHMSLPIPHPEIRNQELRVLSVSDIQEGVQLHYRGSTQFSERQFETITRYRPNQRLITSSIAIEAIWLLLHRVCNLEFRIIVNQERKWKFAVVMLVQTLKNLRWPGIEPGSNRWQRPIITIRPSAPEPPSLKKL